METLLSNNNFYKIFTENKIEYNTLNDIINNLDNSLLNELFKYNISKIKINAYLFDNINIKLLFDYIFNNNIQINKINIKFNENTNDNNKLLYITELYKFSNTLFNIYFNYSHIDLNKNELFNIFIKKCKINKVSIYGSELGIYHDKKSYILTDIINELLINNNIKILNYLIEYDDYEFYDSIIKNNSLEKLYIRRSQNYGLSSIVKNISTLKKVMIYSDNDEDMNELITTNKSLEKLNIYGDKFHKSKNHKNFFKTLENNKTIKSLELNSASKENIQLLSETLNINDHIETLKLNDNIDYCIIFKTLQNNKTVKYLKINLQENNIDDFIELLNNNNTIIKINLTINYVNSNINHIILLKLINCLKNNKNIQYLQIYTSINNNDFQLLTDLIKTNNTIKDLIILFSDIEYNFIFDKELLNAILNNNTIKNIYINNYYKLIKVNSDNNFKIVQLPFKYNITFDDIVIKNNSLKYFILDDKIIYKNDNNKIIILNYKKDF